MRRRRDFRDRRHDGGCEDFRLVVVELDPPPAALVRFLVPPHPAVAVLIDPELGRVQAVDIGQHDRGSVDAALSGPPGHPHNRLSSCWGGDLWA